MSTVPLGRTTYPLLRRSVDVIGGSCERPLRRLIGHLQADQRNIPRYVLRYSVVALALLGLVSLWEAHGDGRIPMLFPLRSIDPGHVSSRHCAAKGVSEAVRWQGLAALAILIKSIPPLRTGFASATSRARSSFLTTIPGSETRSDRTPNTTTSRADSSYTEHF